MVPQDDSAVRVIFLGMNRHVLQRYFGIKKKNTKTRRFIPLYTLKSACHPEGANPLPELRVSNDEYQGLRLKDLMLLVELY